MSPLERAAKEFATQRHGEINQVRKYTGEPYICHPASVVKIVRSVPHTDEMIAAAWLHDTIEDTETSLIEIIDNFGHAVGSLVENLTDISKPEQGNRKFRKALDRAHTAKASPQAKTIKLADLIDNSASIMKHDKKFAEVYLKEKALLLEVLTEGDQTLWNRAKEIVSKHGH